MADPGRLPELLERWAARCVGLRPARSPARPTLVPPCGGTRSRSAASMSVPALRAAKEAAAALGGSLNDFFVPAAVEGAARYHQAEDTGQALTLTFIVSTRAGRTRRQCVHAGQGGRAGRTPGAGGPLRGDGGPRRPPAEVAGVGLLAGLAGVVNLLPASVDPTCPGPVRRVDFATSNVRAAPFDVFIAGARSWPPTRSVR